MSGLGEALAVVSCVAGLIQAYDAGSRIVQHLKARRKAHGALPPSNLLEESIVKGKRDIQYAVSEGNKRFGFDFEAGDITAQLALFQITVNTQNALLERLTVARDDDGVIDFDECVDFSDKGRSEALVALRLLYQRKLEEEMTRKRTAAILKEDLPKEISFIQPAHPAREEQYKAKSTIAEQRVPTSSPKTESETPKCSRWSTGNIGMHNRTQPNDASRLSISSPGSKSGAVTNSSVNAIFDSMRQIQPSSTPTLSTIAPIAPITKYGGCCKYAYRIRDTGPSSGLMRQSINFYNQQIIYACKSTKCKFRIMAAMTKNGYQLDNAVYSRHGLQYRPIFLAKSHVSHNQVLDKHPFACLICIMLKNSSEIYQGCDRLFLHILGHQESMLGETLLEGPLIFSNTGVIVNPEFDINLPDFESPPRTPPTPKHEHHMSTVIDAELQDELCESDPQSKSLPFLSNSMEMTSWHDEPYTNHWAALV